jgi:hypothetical protein
MTSGPGAGEQVVSVRSSDISRLRSRLDALAADLGAPGEPGYLDVAGRLVEAGVELVGAEEQVRERKRAKRRRLNRIRCVVTNGLLGLECLGLGARVVLGTYSPFWLLLLVPMLVCAMGIGIMVRDRKLSFAYGSFWPGVFLGAGTIAGLGLVVSHTVPGGYTAVPAVLGFFMFGTFDPETFSKKTDDDADAEVHDAIPEQREAGEPNDAPPVSEPAAVDPQAAGLAKQVQALEGQLASLSSTIARAGLATQADLDAAGSQDPALVAQMTRGRDARNRLLSTPERAARLAVLTESAQADLDRLDAVASAAEAAKVLGRTRFRAKAYKQTAADLLEAQEKVERANVLCDSLVRRAARAADELKADDAAAAEMADVLDAGVQAHRRLLANARARLLGEVERGSALPAWFLRAFGPTPPFHSPDGWYDAAAAVIAYRVVYGVRAEDEALGPRPLGSDHTRTTEFDHLRDLVRSRRWAE